jgi:uncharacterized membrane protein YfcA
MEYIGYLSSILIGVILGLIGSGGSILTIPVLVYLFSVDVVLATTYSLLIVGITSAIGSLNYLRKHLVNRRSGNPFWTSIRCFGITYQEVFAPGNSYTYI